MLDTANATEIKFSSLTENAANAPQNTMPNAKVSKVASVKTMER